MFVAFSFIAGARYIYTVYICDLEESENVMFYMLDGTIKFRKCKESVFITAQNN